MRFACFEEVQVVKMRAPFSRGAILVCLLALFGCSGASDFEGLWDARSYSGENSCYGEYEDDSPDYVIRLRTGGASDLQYVSFDPTDASEETCVQDFSVDGDVAEIEDGEDCTFEYESVDQMGNPVTVTSHVSYSRDRLKLEGESIHETGTFHSVTSDGQDCTEDFEIHFRRLDE